MLTGNLSSIKKTRATILNLVGEFENGIARINRFDEQAILRAVGTRKYLQEIVDQAVNIGLQGVRVAGLTVLAFPSRLSVDHKGVRVGRKAFASIRPSYLARFLKEERDAVGDFQPGFIDSLAAAYKAKVTPESEVVSLADIYDLLTLLPEVRKSYSEADFVRDLSVIDAHGPQKSKDGKTIAFVAATGTRMNAGFKGVSPSGEDVTYVSIRFD